MRKYCIIDQKGRSASHLGDCFEQILSDTTEEEAIKSADCSFANLTKYDIANIFDFLLAYGEIDEDGCFDLDSADVVKYYIKRGDLQ